MYYHLEDFIKGVRVAMDANDTDGKLVEAKDPATLQLDELIRNFACQAVDQVHLIATSHLLEPTDLMSDYTSLSYRKAEGGYRKGYIQLPADLQILRLVAFQMEGWDRAVTRLILPTEAEYENLYSMCAANFGSPEKPKVYLGPGWHTRENTFNRLWVCSVADTAGYEDMGVVAFEIMSPAKIQNEDIFISTRCVKAAELICASYVLTALGEPQQAQALQEMATTILATQS